MLPNEIFSVAGAVRGSIASWQVGDFGYDASNPYNDAFKSGAGLSPDQAANLSKLVIAEDTAGFFNIPVCQILALRFFPPASGSESSLFLPQSLVSCLHEDIFGHKDAA